VPRVVPDVMTRVPIKTPIPVPFVPDERALMAHAWPHTARATPGRIWPPVAGTFTRIIDGQLDPAVTVRQSRRAKSAADIVDSVALSDGRRLGERSPSRRSVP
jgi:hypothetical protein